MTEQQFNMLSAEIAMIEKRYDAHPVHIKYSNSRIKIQRELDIVTARVLGVTK